MKKSTVTQGIVLFLLVFTALKQVAAQEIKLNLNTSPAPQIPPYSVLSSEDRKEVIAAVEATLTDYSKLATLKDPANRRITRESMGRFKALFVSNAEVVHDYLEFIPVELVPIENYIDEAFRRLERNGIELKIGKADLLKIEDDLSGYFVVSVKVEKFSYNYVNEKQEVLKSDGGRYLEQEFIFDIKKADLSKARIRKIRRICRGNECKTAADYVRYIGPSVGLFVPFITSSTTDFWNNNPAFETNKLNVVGDFSFSGGIDLATNRFSKAISVNKRFFTAIGLNFRYHRIATKLEDVTLVPFDTNAEDKLNPAAQQYTRMVDSVNVTERLNIGSIELPISLGLRLSNINKRHDFIIWATVAPAYDITSTVKFDEGASARHDAMIEFGLPNSYWRALENQAINQNHINVDKGYGPFLVGENLPYEGSPEDIKLKGLSVSLRVSPCFYFHLTENNPTWSFLVGLDASYRIGSFLKHDAASAGRDILTFPRALETSNSILQHYTTSQSAFSVGLRVGLVHRLTTRP